MVQGSSLTFASLCRAFYIASNKPPFNESMLNELSASISRKLGSNSVELDKPYVEDKLSMIVSLWIAKYKVSSLETKINVASILTVIGSRATIDSSYNLYVDLHKFVNIQGRNEVSMYTLIRYALHDCFLDDSDAKVNEFFNKCLVRKSKLVNGRQLSLEQIKEQARSKSK